MQFAADRADIDGVTSRSGVEPRHGLRVLRWLWVTCVLCLILGVWSTRQDNQVIAELRAQGVVVPAVVSDVRTEITRGGDEQVEWAAVQFNDSQGRRVNLSLTFSHGVPADTVAGDHVEIVYDPANLSSVLLTRQLHRRFLNGYGPTAVAGVGTLGGVVWWARARRRKSPPAISSAHPHPADSDSRTAYFSGGPTISGR